MIRIIATADNHLGRNYARMSQAALEKRRRYLRHAFQQACQYALDIHADFFLIAGDLFDITAPRNIDRTFVAERLVELRAANISVFAVAGNHDSPRSRTEEGGWFAAQVYQAAELMRFLDELGGSDLSIPSYVETRGGLSIAIGGFSPNFALGVNEDPLAGVSCQSQSADIRVLLAHLLIEGWIHPDAAEPIARRASVEALRDVDLVIAGDIHEFHLARFGGVHLVTPGSTEWMDYKDMRSGQPGFVDIQIESRNQIQAQHVTIEPQPRILVELGAPDLGQHDPTERIVSQIEAAIEGIEPDPLVLLRIEGTLERGVFSQVNLIEVNERLRDRICHLDLDLSGMHLHREIGPLAPRPGRRTLAQELRLAMQDLSAELSTDDQTLLPELEQEMLAVFEGDEEDSA